MSLGPVMIDVMGTSLCADDIRRLKHPLVGGVILFSRNYESPEQLRRLTQEIQALRNPHLLIAVDHEGGRVQRFREGFTRLPAMRELGHLWEKHSARARMLAHQTGYVLAAELRAHGVDLSFTPVLDLDFGTSSVIGDRAFHRKPHVVAELAHQLMLGLREGGMVAVGKHFPGHGFVQADSHHEIPVDDRSFADIEMEDMAAFRQMIDFGVAGLMPAHVIYPQVDSRPAGFSSVWLKDILRNRLGFQGVIFSDDLSMAGAHVAGGPVQRTEAALRAGCDMILLCNKPEDADELLAGLRHTLPAIGTTRLLRMHGKPHPPSIARLHEDAHYLKAVHAVGSLGFHEGSLPLDDPTHPQSDLR